MKKVYMKPRIAIERYQLSQMISGCSASVVFATVSGCANNISMDAASEFERLYSLGMFNDSAQCQYEPSSDLVMNSDKLCYFTSTSNQVFGS